MKFRKSVSLLVLLIAVLSLAASVFGVFTNQGEGTHEFTSIHGEIVKIYGKGLYQFDSVSTASQGIAQDVVTIILGIPLLVISLFLARKGSIKGRLLLTGTLGYFLYTYVSYAFLWMYNPFFLIYVILMSASFFAFVLCMMSFDIQKLSSCFGEKLPVRFLGGFSIFVAVTIALMWLGRIVPPLISHTIPAGLEHYTTLVIQAMDLGFIVPVAMISGILLMKKRPFGYLLASVIYLKEVTMLTALTAMIIGQIVSGVKVGIAEIVMFPAFNLIVIYCMILIMKNVKEPAV